MQASFRHQISLPIAALLALTGCIDTRSPLDSYIMSLNQRQQLADKKSSEESHARYMFLLSCGAMDPLDRAELNLDKAYYEAKYGIKEKSTSYSKRCQQYRAGKINSTEAVAMGKGDDEK